MKWILIKLIPALIAIYALSLLAIYLFQDALIFKNKRLPRDHTFSFDIPFEENLLTTSDNEKISVLHFKSDVEPVKGIILYFHGNSGSLERWGEYSIDFTSLGYDIIMLDYRSYGKSSGKINEANMYQDAVMIWDWAQKKFDYQKWVLYGRSIGSPVASYLASKTEADLLCLETPFDELNGAGGAAYLPFNLKYSFSNKEHLKSVACETFIIYGGSDNTVPESSTLKLKALLKKEDTMVRIPGGGHKNLREFDLYHESLKEILHK